MQDFVLNLIDNYAYIGMFIGMVLEAIIIIIPSELILATGGILAAKNIFTFKGAFITGLLGSVFCAIVIYLMGYFGGELFIKKYGKYFHMKEEEITKSENWFKKYGLVSALIGRNIPIVRTLISLPVGINKLSFTKFIIYTTIGSIPWTILFVYLGYVLGNNWIIINAYTDKVKVIVRIIIIIILVKIGIRIFKKK